MAKILVVDDEAVLLQLLRQVLEDAGHEVLTEIDSGQVIPRIRAERPALVMLDLFIGEVSGIKLIQDLRADPGTQGIAIILCTGASREVDEQRELLEQLKVPVLAKPFDLDDLVNLVSAQLPAG